MSDTKFIGVLWDRYTPAVEARAFNHLMSLAEVYRTAPGGTPGLVVVSESGGVDRVCKKLGLPLTNNLEQANTWLVYEVGSKPELPDSCTDPINFIIEPTETADDPNQLEVGNPHYPSLFLKQDTMVVPPGRSMTLNQKRPPHNARPDPWRVRMIGG